MNPNICKILGHSKYGLLRRGYKLSNYIEPPPTTKSSCHIFNSATKEEITLKDKNNVDDDNGHEDMHAV